MIDPRAALSLAASQVGFNERDQKAALQDYLTTGGANLDPAVTAWCAAFVNATLQQTGIQGTESNMARSFMDWGQPVTQPQEGDLAVFSRGDPNGPYGHVGFFKGYDAQGNIMVLGGNQGDAVSILPYSPDRLLGFRRAGESVAQQPGMQTRPSMPPMAAAQPIMQPADPLEGMGLLSRFAASRGISQNADAAPITNLFNILTQKKDPRLAAAVKAQGGLFGFLGG
jgi:uncharacterized protein (TIGR02594 family)